MGRAWSGQDSIRTGLDDADGADAVFTTFDVDQADQFGSYRDWMAPVVDVRAIDRDHRGFAAAQSIWTFGGLRLLHEVFDAVEGSTSSASGRPSAVDHWVLALHKAGDTTVGSGDRVTFTPACGLSFVALGHGARLRQEASETLYLFIPRDRCPGDAVRLDRLHNLNLEGPPACLLADHLLALERSLPLMDPQARAHVAEATLGLLRACLPEAEATERQRPERENALHDGARRFIRRHVTSPLSPADICVRFGISRSHLYRLFREDGGVARAIRSARLEAARAALSDPADHRRIHHVAEDYGFGSAEEFSRSFRRRFGCRPSDVYRARGHLGDGEAVPVGIARIL